MRQGRTLQDLGIELERQANTKRDFIVNTGKVTASVQYPQGEGDGNLLGAMLDSAQKQADADEEARRVLVPRVSLEMAGGHAEHFDVNRWAHSQMADRLNIPLKYYDRMVVEAPTLWEQNVNHWLHTDPQQRLMRTLDGGLRAFLSDRYRILDHFDVARAVVPLLQKHGCKVQSCEVTETKLYIKATSPKLERTHPDHKLNSAVQGGIVIGNSEVGAGTLFINAFFMDLWCLNGCTSERAFKRTHLGKRHEGGFEGAEEYYSDATRSLDDAALFSKVKDTVDGVLSEEAFDKFLGRMHEAYEAPKVKDVQGAVEVTAKRLGLADGERKNVLTHFIERGDLSQFGMMSAVTQAAQDEEMSYDRASELESLGGKVLELPKSDWQEIVDAVAA